MASQLLKSAINLISTLERQLRDKKNFNCHTLRMILKGDKDCEWFEVHMRHRSEFTARCSLAFSDPPPLPTPLFAKRSIFIFNAGHKSLTRLET